MGEDSFTKCTLYVFPNHWEDPEAFLFSHLTNRVFVLPHLSCVFDIIMIIFSVTKALRKNYSPVRRLEFMYPTTSFLVL